MLDYKMTLKPKATDFAIEGLVMFKVNKTSDWRSKLSKEQLDNFIEVARRSKKIFDYFICPLLEDYLNGWVRIMS